MSFSGCRHESVDIALELRGKIELKPPELYKP